MLASESGALRFFLIQPLGIIIEDVARSAYGSVYGETSLRAPTAKERFLGAIWVVSWGAWTVPAYMYPVLDKTSSGRRAGVVPFSVIGYVASEVTA